MNASQRKPPPPTFATRTLDSIERFLQRISEREGPMRRLVHMAHLLVVGIRRSQLTRMAAALSYRTIFGLIPVVVISMLLLAAFATKDQIEHIAMRTLRFTGLSAVVDDSGLSRIVQEQGPEGPQQAVQTPTQAAGGPDAETDHAPAGAEGQEAPGVNAASADQTPSERRRHTQLHAWIDGVYNGIKSIKPGPVGLVGLLTLVYAAISMLVEIEKAFNQIYNAPEGRSWVRRITQYWTLLTLGTVFLVTSFYVQEQIMRTASQFAGAAEAAHQYRGALVHGVGFLLTVAISSLLLWLVYLIVPNTRVHALPALIGAITAAILWESGKWGFGRYVTYVNTHDTGYSRFYGTVAMVPLFMLWIYLTWLIVLMGLQLASALQTQRVTSAEGFRFSVLATFGLIDEDRAKHSVKIVDPAGVLAVLVCVAERFAAGKTSDHSHVASDTGIDEQAVADMLDRLAGAKLLLRLADAEHEGTYTLARPPETIPAGEALLLAQELIGTSRAAENKILLSLSRARVAALEGKTIADLMERRTPPPVVADPLPAVEPAKA